MDSVVSKPTAYAAPARPRLGILAAVLPFLIVATTTAAAAMSGSGGGGFSDAEAIAFSNTTRC